MPPLRVDPEDFLDRFVGRITGNDIDLESEEFNRAFTVSCPDRKFASDVLHPQMMEFLLQHRQLGWRFEQDSMLVVARRAARPGADRGDAPGHGRHHRPAAVRLDAAELRTAAS